MSASASSATTAATSYVWGAPLRKKSDALTHIRYVMVQEFGSKVEIFASDQGGEYMSYGLGDLLAQVGARQQTRCAGDSPQNGAPEKLIRDLFDMIRTVLHDTCA